ncbi:MAG: Crp/Fnr family transcriptional regulator [Gammaproteobacteria bacterium CG11_big_fil_rev_8_21_14_0_20_46_22]|nr:MAG: Crp/Fnr family transcriptional regulator [Gammaproteobacteria bacterium CG12_big_fil_rev_8_21_14_0_65_46_12]PIR11030.1 MAG: Crp/Fnr family transcriptional regulator [Gammaproteobacteria bacterium CG11_big_fil_rev_8_21_14_0_20_46_22]
MSRAHDCSHCALAKLCLPFSLDDASLETLSAKIKDQTSLKKRDILYKKGQTFSSLYAVKSGAFKASIYVKDQEIITHFFLPGEIIGFEGIHAKHYATTTIALNDSTVCEINFDDLKHLAQTNPLMQDHLFSLMSHDIAGAVYTHPHHEALSQLAAFLVQLSTRFQRRGLSATRFELPMTRQDIANHLGLALETVSRLMSKLQAQKIIKTELRLLTIISLEKLSALI